MKHPISKTKLKKHLRAKTSPVLIETIELARKNHAWLSLAKTLTNSTRKRTDLNLVDIDKKVTPGDTVLVPGKVLSLGNVSKKIRLCALAISKPALHKLKKSKSEYLSILDEIRSNPKAEGVKILQ